MSYSSSFVPTPNVSTSGSGETTCIAGEDLSAGDLVIIAPDGSIAATASRAYKTTALKTDRSSESFLSGFVVEGASSGSQCKIKLSGTMGGFNGLTPGALQYISESSGQITETAPENAVMVGIAVSGSTVLINQRGNQAPAYPVTLGGTKGYCVGGYINSSVSVSTVEKFTFATDTKSTPASAQLSAPEAYRDGCLSQESTCGYTTSGTTDKLIFSTDTMSTHSSNSDISLHGSVSDSNKIGYLGGGTGPVSTIRRFPYATGAFSVVIGQGLNTTKSLLSGISGGESKGYFLGGQSTGSAYSATTTADKLTFSTGTVSYQASANLSLARYEMASVSDGTTKGYVTGGYEAVNGHKNRTDKTTFATDVTSMTTDYPISVSRLAGISGGPSYGYFAGGNIGNYDTNLAYKLSYSTDTFSAKTSLNLGTSRGMIGGISDSGF